MVNACDIVVGQSLALIAVFLTVTEPKAGAVALPPTVNLIVFLLN